MKKQYYNTIRGFLLFFLFSFPLLSFSLTTSWVGGSNTRWRNAANWTNGVPDATVDVVIGDASFTGSNQPTLKSGKGSADCLSLTVTGTISKPATLTIEDRLNVGGTITIGTYGALIQDKPNADIYCTGDWFNSGSFTTSNQKCTVYFSGETSQTLGGSVVTAFEKIQINSGSVVTLDQNLTVLNNMELNGTLNPTESFTVSGDLPGKEDIDINAGGVLKVYAATFTENYNTSSLNINVNKNTSIIDYASSTINQSIANLSYQILRISGDMTKFLTSNTIISNNLEVNSGTLDFLNFTANRSSSGGNLIVSAGAVLKIGGTNTFPTNYTARTFASTSTVEYYGGNQTISAQPYGNLTLNSSGSATKTMPSTEITLSGNLTTTVSSGTLEFTAQNTINVSGNITLAAGSIFNGGNGLTHSTTGNWINNGTYNGCSAVFNFNGVGTTISGSGINNFGDLEIAGSGVVLHQNSSLTLCGNFSTIGGGSFTHISGGTGSVTMAGASKTIAGSNIVFSDFIISGTATIATSSTFQIAGDFISDGAFMASGGTIDFSGNSKIISGTSTIQLAAVTFSGTITTARDLSVSSNLNVIGSFTASAGQVTFNGTSTLSGTANLYDIRITNTKTLTMSSAATLGIAGAVTYDVGAIFDPMSNIPNTINYNGTGAQSLVFTTYHNLTLSGGNVKTPLSGIAINGNCTIAPSATFSGENFTHSIAGNWINNGTFVFGTSTIQFNGTSDATITGVTTFYNLTINKGTTNKVTLGNNISVSSLKMTSGTMLTGSNAITITSTRTGNGIILGTITRTHAFTTSTDYAFEGPNNSVNFSSITGTITSLTVVVTVGPNVTFPGAASINRTYSMSVTGSTTYDADVRFHYEQSEINGNVENAMTIWNDGGVGTWTDLSKTSNDVTANWVELTGQSSLLNTWTISEGLIKYTWDGSVNIAWENPNNWTPVGVPANQDVVYIGDIAFTNQPTITTTDTIKKMYFSSITASTLTFGTGGNLTVKGNIDGIWSTDAIHTINVADQILTIQSDFVSSAGISNRIINLEASTGTINIGGSLTQTGSSSILFSGPVNLNIKGDFNYQSGVFTPATSTVNYDGDGLQQIGGITYYNLNVAKPSAIANINYPVIVSNNFALNSNSIVDVNETLIVTGDINIGIGTTLNVPSSAIIYIGGNWLRTGTFIPGLGTVEFNGTGPQSVNATTFKNIISNKSSDTLTVLGDLVLNGDINIQDGAVEVSTFDITRSSLGGTATLGAGTLVRFGGSGLQINNFASLSADITSTIEFYTSSSRILPPITYGNLIISNGGSNTKIMVGPTTIGGNLTVNSGSTLTAPATTLTLEGDFTMNGTFNANNGTIILNGTANNVNGNIIYNNMVVNGSYDFQSGSLTFLGNLDISSTGNFDLGTLSVISDGDFTNSGVVNSSGVVTFTGTRTQRIRLLNAIVSASTGVINFNGTFSPVFNSTSSPQFATVNINNTDIITASQPWTVFVAMNIANGSVWDGGSLTHTFYNDFTNSGSVLSSGKLDFRPALSADINLGTNFTSTNLVEFGGVGVITLIDDNPTFTSVTISNTAGVSPSSNWTIGQDVLITAGAVLNAGAHDYTVSGKWNNSGTFNGQTSTVTFNSIDGSDAILGTGSNEFYNLNFPAGTILDVAADISVQSNFTNDATTLNFLNQEVKFVGTGLSVLDGSTSCVFSELEVAKTSDSLQLNTDATVTNFLTLTSGVLKLNMHSLAVTNPIPTAISRTSGFVLSEDPLFTGNLSWTIGTTISQFEFPFGTLSGDYIPFLFDLNSGDAGTVAVSTYGTGSNNLPLPPTVTNLNNGIANNSSNTVDRYFFIDLVDDTTPNADVTFNASAAEVGGISTLRAQRWGVGWEDPISGQTAGATSVKVPGVTQFSPWAISGNDIPLPITLVDFKAVLVGDNVKLSWQTLIEKNNDYFEVRKSKTGEDFKTLGRVKGEGNSITLQTYNYVDYQRSEGVSYYMLKQVDFDGTSTNSKIIAIDEEEYKTNQIYFNVSPNPASDFINIVSNTHFSEGVVVQLIDGSGKVIKTKKFDSVDLSQGMNLDVSSVHKGVYVLKILSGEILKSLKVVIK